MIEISIRLGAQTEALTISGRERMPRFSIEYISQREIIESKSQGTDQSSATVKAFRLIPRSKFELIGRLFFYLIFDINRTSMFVHRRVDVKFFLIEVTECEYFTLGADDIRPAEFLSGTGGEFTSDYIFVCPVITFHDDTIDGCLRSLVDPNFDIDRILDDSNFYRLRRNKQVTIIHIKRRDIVPI